MTSISLDHHKFGLAPKGMSAVFYKTKELSHCQYYVNTEWKGGIYATTAMPGSRSGFAGAGAWYSLTHVGKRGFKENAQLIISSTKQTADNLRALKGV